jgi:hypothetical protein
MTRFAAEVTSGLFIAAALMLWAGWTLLPVRIGPFLRVDDFAAIRRVFRRWIWLYRVHLFGYLVTAMAFVALATGVDSDRRVLVWPGVVVLAAGAIVSALAAAFYYHFGAWGAVGFREQPDAAVEQHVAALRTPTEYVTCLVRFGRVFFGLGQTVLAVGLLPTSVLPVWLLALAALLGVGAMALTMAFPDELQFFGPLFHANAQWMAAAGVTILGRAA